MNSQNQIKIDVNLYALEIGRMIGLERRVNDVEQAALYERFITSRSTQNMRFGDFLAWVCIRVDKSEALFGRAHALADD